MNPPQPDEQIARQSVQGSLYSVAASGITLSLGFLRSVLLARLLLPEHFGVAALALFFLNLAGSLRGLGVDSAIIHRQQADERILSTYFTLRVLLVLGSLGVLAALTPLISRFYPQMPLLGPVMLGFIATDLLKGLNTAQETMMSRNLVFRGRAVTDVMSSVAMTLVAPYLAWRGWGVWSLVGERLIGHLARGLAVWVTYRQWRPRPGWDPESARWLWGFGKQVWMSGNLSFLLDRFDDFWTGTALGESPLGFYSRAYEFANYPRRVLASPVLSVFFPVFARLQDDRLRLSRAFFRVTSLLVRVGFWFSLTFILAAPEFIGLVLGPRWLPMLPAFQLMVVYALLDPMMIGAGNLLMSTGHPGLVARARVVQLAVFVPAVIALSRSMGITGVALAADLMILTGTLLLFRQARRIVSFSSRRLALWPAVALVVTAGVVLLLNPLWASLSPWGALLGKGGLIAGLFWGSLWLTEREQLCLGWKMVWDLLRPRLEAT